VAFIGRREDNDVVLPFSFVSSRHGRIVVEGGRVSVEDMGSTNGTLVNGEPLDPMAARVVSPDDRIEIDRIVLRARWVERDADTAEPTYLEVSVPAVVRTKLAAPARPSPFPILRDPDASGEMDVEAAVRLQTRPAAAPLAPPRPAAPEAPVLARRSQAPAAEEDDAFRFYALLFRALGALAVLAALALLGVVLLG
jgi:predicted component of type VI protein secretion system